MKKLSIFLGCGLSLAALSACQVTKDQFDFSKKAPDEFAVVARAPLEMPDNYDLPKPRLGAPRPQETSPELQAKQALFGENATLNNGVATQGEDVMLQKTGAQAANSNIRNVVDAETEELVKENTSTFNRILGRVGKKVDAPATVVDPVKEVERIKQNQQAGKPITEGKTPTLNQ